MFTFATKLVHSITLKLVLIWAVAMSVGVLSLTIFEQRQGVFAAGHDAPKTANNVGSAFSISKETKRKIALIVESNPNIISFSVVAADIRLNTRRIVYFYGQRDSVEGGSLIPILIDDERVQAAVRLPLFTNNVDANRQIVKLMNGEFLCVPYSSSQIPKAAPDLNTGAISICKSSLPPYYGFFSGFISMTLRTDPSLEFQSRLKIQLDTLANEIYFGDVIPTSKKYGP